EALAVAHPTLRSRLRRDGTSAVLVVEQTSSAAELTVVADGSLTAAAALEQTVHRLDPDAGRMVAATVLDGRLLLSIHHLAVDVVSWLILADDLRNLEQGREIAPEGAGAEVDSAPVAPVIRGGVLGDRYTDPAL